MCVGRGVLLRGYSLSLKMLDAIGGGGSTLRDGDVSVPRLLYLDVQDGVVVKHFVEIRDQDLQGPCSKITH